jgi:hypothetical protein
MRKILNKPTRDEKGQALLITLILLLVGGLIIAPLLGYMSTGLKAGKIHEERMQELYAADAGVEDAIQRLISGNITVPAGGSANFTGPNMNGKTVKVTIQDKGGQIYKITSVATDGGSANTTLEVYVGNMNLLNNAVSSVNKIELKPGVSVNGTQNAAYPPELWPTADDLKSFFLSQVNTSSPYGSSSIDVNSTPIILPTGSLYRIGNLGIDSSVNGKTGTLNGTVYVTGDLNIGGAKDFTLDLNGHTIFVEGAITISSKCTITGSGCIIAIGDVFFAPKTDNNPNNFVFVMSVDGEVKMNPMGSFYGSIAGNVEVTLQPNCTMTWTTWADEGLNLPSFMMAVTSRILAWKVSP